MPEEDPSKRKEMGIEDGGRFLMDYPGLIKQALARPAPYRYTVCFKHRPRKKDTKKLKESSITSNSFLLNRLFFFCYS